MIRQIAVRINSSRPRVEHANHHPAFPQWPCLVSNVAGALLAGLPRSGTSVRYAIFQYIPYMAGARRAPTIARARSRWSAIAARRLRVAGVGVPGADTGWPAASWARNSNWGSARASGQAFVAASRPVPRRSVTDASSTDQEPPLGSAMTRPRRLVASAVIRACCFALEPSSSCRRSRSARAALATNVKSRGFLMSAAR